MSAGLGAGEVVNVFDGATLLGQAVVTGTTWSFTPVTTLAEGQHVFTARVEDAAGNAAANSASYTITVLDTVPPSTTGAITAAGDDAAPVTGNVANGGNTNDTTLALSGTLSAALNGAGPVNSAETLHVFDGATDLGVAVVTGTTWTFTTPALAGGPHNFTVRVIDGAGNQGTASPAYSVTVDTSAPTQTVAITAADDNVAPATGNVASGGSTNDPTPGLSGTLSAGLAAGEVLDVFDGATLLGQAVVSGTTWSFTPAVLADGAHSFTAQVRDAAGNTSAASAAYVLTVDTAAPTQTGGIGGATDTLNVALAGGETLHVFDGATDLGLAVVTGTTWTFTTPALAAGTHDLTATVFDAASNAGNPSVIHTVTVDTTAPTQTAAITAADDNVVPATGNVASGGNTNDPALDLAGTLSAGLGADEVLNIFDGATLLGQAVVTGTTWTFTTPTLANGAHSLTAQVADAAGNTSTASAAYTLTVDTTAPTQTGAITGVTDNAAPVTGNVASGGSTNDPTLDLAGTLSAGLAAGEVLNVYDGSTLLGQAVVTGTTWTFTTPALAAGAHSLIVQVADAAGNTGTASPAYTVTVDTTTPTQTVAITAANDNVAPVTGNVASGGNTNDPTLDLAGTLSAGLALGEVVNIFDGATLLGQAVVTGTTWTFTTPALSGGAHSLTAQVADAAGNTSTASAAYTLTVDTTAPTQTGAITGVTDNVAPVTGNVASGGSTNDPTLDLAGTLSAGLAAGEVLNVYDGGTLLGQAVVTGTTWTFTTPALAAGAHSLNVQVADAAGNTGASTMGFADVPANYTNAGPPLASTEFESAEFTHLGFASGDVIDFSGANRQVLINGMGGADVITGGSGNDTIKVADTTFTSIAGGTGFDLVEFTAAATVNDAALAKMSNIEAIKLGAGGQTIILDDTRVKAMSGTTDALYVQGDGNDTVQLNGGVGTGASQWHLISTANGLNTYVYFDATNIATTAKLLIDTGITNVVSSGAPITTSTSANINGNHTMSLADFNFADPNGDDLSAIRVNSTAGATGTLRLNGVAVSNGQTITANDILAGKLQWVEAAGPTTSVKTFDINYNVIDSTNLMSGSAATLTLNRAAATGTAALNQDATGGSYFGSNTGSTGTFWQANAQAVNNGGHLAIASGSVNEFTVLKNTAFVTGTAWVNLRQDPLGAEPAGDWFWADNFALDTGVTPWRTSTGEPNNSGGGDFAQINLDGAGAANMKLNDVPDGTDNILTEFESAEFIFYGFSSGETIDFSAANRQVLIDGFGGADTITGGSSHDTIKVPDTTFASINGGAGFDVVEFTAAATVNDAVFAKLSNIEAIKLGNGAQNITLTDSRVKALSSTTDTLYIQGDASDTVHVNGGVGNGASQWHLTSTANGLNTYVYYDASNAATTAKLLIDASITNVVV